MLCISVISIVSRILPSASSASSKIMRHAPTLGYSSVGQAPHHRSREAATDEDSACVAHHHESPPQPEGACIAPAPPSPTSAVLSPLAARRAGHNRRVCATSPTSQRPQGRPTLHARSSRVRRDLIGAGGACVMAGTGRCSAGPGGPPAAARPHASQPRGCAVASRPAEVRLAGQ